MDRLKKTIRYSTLLFVYQSMGSCLIDESIPLVARLMWPLIKHSPFAQSLLVEFYQVLGWTCFNGLV